MTTSQALFRRATTTSAKTSEDNALTFAQRQVFLLENIYESLCNYIVSRINTSLNADQINTDRDRCISILDGLPADDGTINLMDK